MAKTKKNTVVAAPSMTRVGGGPLFPNLNVQPPSLDLGFTPTTNNVGYTGSAWNYGSPAQTYAPASPTRLAVQPVAQPIGRNPFDTVIAQARQWLQNPNQMRQAANQQVGAQVKAALGASNASSKAEQQQLAALEARAAGFSQALAGMGMPAGQQVYDQYLGAANTIASLGAGLTGQVAADQQAASDQATAAVAQQLGSSANVGGYDPAALRSAAYYTGTTLPATTLAQQAAQQAQLTRGQYAAGAGQVDQVRRDYESQAIQALNQRAAERASIVAQRPALFQDALKANRDDQQALQAHLDSLTTNSVNWKSNEEKQAYQKTLDAYRKSQDVIAHKERAATLAQNARTIKANAVAAAARTKLAQDALTVRDRASQRSAIAQGAAIAEKGREFDAHNEYLGHLADIQQMGITHITPDGKLVGGYVYVPKLKAVLPGSAYLQYLASGDANAAKLQAVSMGNKAKVAIANAGNKTKVQTAGIRADATIASAKIRAQAQQLIADQNNATRDADSRRRYNATVLKERGKAALGGLTAGQFTDKQNQALKQLDVLRYGIPGGQRKTADGTAYEADPTKPPIPGVPYHQALIHLGEMGPATPAWENYVLAVVNNAYPPGENGRPLTAAGQAWLSRRMLQAAQKFGKSWGGLPANYFLQGPVGKAGAAKQGPKGPVSG